MSYLLQSDLSQRGMLVLAYELLVLAPVAYGVSYALLRAARDETPLADDVLVPFQRAYVPSVLSNLLVGVLMLVAAVLVGVPAILALVAVRRAFVPQLVVDARLGGVLGGVLLGIGVILAGVRLIFVPYLVVDEGLGAVAALKASWRRTAGHGWRVLGVWLLGLPIALLGVLALLVGIIPAALWASLAFASLFVAITARQTVAPPAAASAPSGREAARPPDRRAGPRRSALSEPSGWRRPRLAALVLVATLTLVAVALGAATLPARIAIAEADRAFAAGRWSEAVLWYGRAIDWKPRDSVLYVRRSTAYRPLGQLERALADANRAVEIDPRSARAYGNRSTTYRYLASSSALMPEGTW